jgi:hypothetical protein
MPKKKSKLDSLNQTHGKVEKPITLDQVWGDSGKSRYGTLELDEYESYLANLNKSDIQAHAVKIGLVPVDDRDSLTRRLKQEFLKYTSQFKARPSLTNSKSISKKSKDILSEGR